jgi:hypothetical protein
LDVTLSVLASVGSDVLYEDRRSKQTVPSALFSQITYTERPSPSLVERGTLLPSSDGGGGHRHTYKKEIAQAYFREVG